MFLRGSHQHGFRHGGLIRLIVGLVTNSGSDIFTERSADDVAVRTSMLKTTIGILLSIESETAVESSTFRPSI
jgi:hypothetical protein